MGELRWNPLLKTYTMVSANRQKRPHLPKDWCPFCPGEGKNVPKEYEVFKYDNDFPTLKLNPDKQLNENTDFYKTKENYGKCEVILYSPDHYKTLPELSFLHIKKLVDLWQSRVEELSKDKKIKYIFIFENRGKEVGVTMPHPHGQLYAYPWVPLKLKTELDASKEFYSKNNECLMCKINKEEKNFKERVVYENDSFLSYIPFFTDYPYGVFITIKNHKGNIKDFTEKEKKDLAETLKYVTGGLDKLYNKKFPYMMVMHQTPQNVEEYSNSQVYYHFHIEFYPPLRDENKIKWYASSEMGAWAAANTMNVEETAPVLKNAINKFIKSCREDEANE